MSNFSNFTRTQNTQFFNHLNPLYDNERKLYDLLVTEAYNCHGITMTYNVLSYNTKKDRIFGEDNNRSVLRAFDFQAYVELPRDVRSFSIMGITWNDIFHLYVSKKHFAVASKYSNGIKSEDSYIPHVGDLVRISYNELKDPTKSTRLDTDTPSPNDLLRSSEYNNTYYEIIMVKQQTEQFLQQSHTWDLNVRVYRDKSIPLSGTIGDGSNTSATFGDLWKYTNQSDLFDIGKFINKTDEPISNKENIEYNKNPNECDPNDPFNNWWSDK